jgi:hypothetical protein
MQRFLRSILVLLLLACTGPRAGKEAAAAAARFNEVHAKRALQASVAGDDCAVLLIHIDDKADDDLVESIHYGIGDYQALGGVEAHADKHGFRAVVYRDSEGELHTYGATTRQEAKELRECD